MDTSKIIWKRSGFCLKRRFLESFVARFDNMKDWHAAWDAHWRMVVSEGGALFRFVERAELVATRHPLIPHVSYKSSGPDILKLCRFSLCSFYELLEVVHLLGFPGETKLPGVVNNDPIIKDPEMLFNTCKLFLLKYNKHKKITISQVESGYMFLELISQNDVIEQKEVDQICAFNEIHFRNKYITEDELDQKINWMKRGFFTIGFV